MQTEDKVSFSGSWNDDDDIREASLAVQSQLPASMVNPAEVYGNETWQDMLFSDVVNNGSAAQAGFQFDWNFGMTPGQRARSLIDQTFKTNMDALVKSAVAETVKAPVDPEKYAVELAERRSRRR